jgi:hypothetical protein
VALLSAWLDRAESIVEAVESRLLNVQGKAVARSRNRADIERPFEACFTALPGSPRELSRQHGQLAAAHRAAGFEAALRDTRAHTLDPLELTMRAYAHWDRQRWPGRNGRLVYARMLYSVFLLRQLEYLSLRIWDDEDDGAGDRLQDVQRLLERLNQITRPNVLVRDARWLIHTAQSLESLPAGTLPDVVAAQEHCVTSDVPRALETGATAFPRSQILLDRNEGRFLASAEADGKWFGMSKVILTVCTSQGKDALVTDVPEPVVEVLRLTCQGLLVVCA